MLEPTYMEWIFAGLAFVLYLYIWINGTKSIRENERRKRWRRK